MRTAAATATATGAHRGPGVGAEMGPRCLRGPHCPPTTTPDLARPGQPQAPPGSHNSQAILATRSGVSPDPAMVPPGAGALWGPAGCPIAPPCGLGGDGQGCWVIGGHGPPPHLPAAARLGVPGPESSPGVARGCAEWNPRRERPWALAKVPARCHGPGLLATSPAPGPHPAGRASLASLQTLLFAGPPPAGPPHPSGWLPGSPTSPPPYPPVCMLHTGGGLFTHVGAGPGSPGSGAKGARWGQGSAGVTGGAGG